MSIITAQILEKITHTHPLFSLEVEHRADSTVMRMELFSSIVNTRYLPQTSTLLKMHLPSILHSKCFNENHYPFRKEVKQTEIGHLFEHILLEYLSRIKITKGMNNYIHNGVTDWNWEIDPIGVFHISVDAGLGDKELFGVALAQTMSLMNMILTSRPLVLPVTPTYLPTPNYLPAER